MRRYLIFIMSLLVIAVPLVQAQDSRSESPAPRWVHGFGNLWFATLSPSGELLVVSTTTGVYLYNTADPAALPIRLEGHTDTVQNVTFSPDGKQMVTPSYDGTVRLWNLPGGEPVWTASISEPCCEGSPQPPRTAEFSTDGSLLLIRTGMHYPGPKFLVNAASGQAQVIVGMSNDAAVKLRHDHIVRLRVQDGTAVISTIYADGDGFRQEDQPVTGKIDLPPTSIPLYYNTHLLEHYFVIVPDCSPIQVIRLDDYTLLPPIQNPTGWVSAYQDTLFYETGDTITAVNLATDTRVDVSNIGLGNYYGGQRRLFWDPAQNLAALDLVTLESHIVAPTPSWFYESKGYVLHDDLEGKAVLTNLENGQTVEMQGVGTEFHTNDMMLEVVDQTALIVYGGEDIYINYVSSTEHEIYHTLYVGIWDITSGAALVEPQRYTMLAPTWINNGRQWAVTATRYLTDEIFENGLLIADLAAPSLRWYGVPEASPPFTFGPPGMYYSTSNGLFLLDLASGETTKLPFDDPTGDIRDLAYSPDGQWIASSSDDNTVRLWNAASGEQSGVLALDNPDRLAFVPGGVVILNQKYGSGAGSELVYWPVSGSGIIRNADGYGQINDITAVGSLVAIAGESSILLFDFSDGNFTLRQTLSADSDPAVPDLYSTVALDPTGQMVAAAEQYNTGEDSFETVIDLWDISTGAMIKRLDVNSFFAVSDLSFSADGTQLAVVSTNTELWDLTGPLEEPLYVTSGFADSGATFAGNRLVRVEQNSPTNNIQLLDETGMPITLRRKASTNGVVGGSHVHYPIAARPDGGQFAAADPGGVIAMWDMPALAAPSPAPVEVIATCDRLENPPVEITADQPVRVIWSWFAVEIPQVFDHMTSVSYAIMLDSNPLQNWQTSTIRRDAANDNRWTVYYALDAGKLAPGEHVITYKAMWRETISDGLTAYGPDTPTPEDSSACHFTVQ